MVSFSVLFAAATALMAEDDQVILIDGFSTNFGFPFVVGDSGTNNFLIITNGGSAISGGTFIGSTDTAHENGAIVTGANSYLEGALRVGDYGSRNLLVITNGGRVHSNEGTLGGKAVSQGNQAFVVGSNSAWTVDATLQIGWSGSSNRLVLSDGATINASGSLGDDGVSSNNVVEITGAGSVWNGGFYVGFAGVGNRLQVSQDGRVVGGAISVGVIAGSGNNLVVVSGPRAELDLRDGFLKVGETGSSNRVTISDGATVTSRDGYLGGPNTVGAGHFNRVEVTGSNSVWNVREDLYVSQAGSNNAVILSDGGTLNANALTIGGISNNAVRAAAGGTLTVTNAVLILNGALALYGGSASLGQLWCDRANGGEILLNAGALEIARTSGVEYGTNALVIGATPGQRAILNLLPGVHSVNAGGGFLIGEPTGSRGELFVSGPNSVVTGPVYAGENDRTHGSGLASVTAGATLEANVMVSGTNGSGQISNEGGVFQFTVPSPSITNLSEGSIVVTNGTVSFRGVANADPRLFGRTTSNLVLQGDNAFRLNNSTGVVLDAFTFAKAGDNGFSRLELLGGKSAWNSTNLIVGPEGEMFVSNTIATVGVPRGTLVVTNGSQVWNFVDADSFNRPISNLNVLLSGTGTVWTNGRAFAVGYDGGSNTFSIERGAVLYAMNGYLGYSATSSNNVVRVTGPGSKWITASGLNVGRGGSRNRLDLVDGAEVRALALTIGASASSVSNEVWVNGGQLTATNLSGAATIQVRAGTLGVMGGTVRADLFGLGPDSAARVAFGAGFMELRVATINNGAPFVVGDGTNSATLALKSFVHSFSQGLILSSNAWLLGGGAINGGVTNRGGIAVRTSPGSFRVSGTLRFEGDSEFLVHLGGPSPGADYDFVDVSSAVNLAGTLRAVLTNDFRPWWSNSFNVLRFQSRSGEFANARSGQRVSVANGAGSFRASYTPTTLTLSDYRLDLNGDGIDDAWAIHYFSSDFLPVGFGPDDRFGDKDGDGLNNYQEYLAGTDPLNPLSTLRITAVGVNPSGDVVIDFQCVSNRTYGVLYSTDVVSWKAIASVNLSNPEPGSCRWTDDGSQTGERPANGSPRFYRVSVD
jgi:T5SS/PEP-CTERM-associated repeat protein